MAEQQRKRPLSTGMAAQQEIPALDSGRVTFAVEYPTTNPEDWSTVTDNYGNYESYQPEYESENYVAYGESSGVKTMMIDDEVVFSYEFAIYEDAEDAAPPDEDPPTDEAMYAEYYAIKSGAMLKGRVLQLHQYLTRDELGRVAVFLRDAEAFQRRNGEATAADTIRQLTCEMNNSLSTHYEPTLDQMAETLFEMYLRLKYHSGLSDEMAEQLNAIHKEVQRLAYAEEDKRETVGAEV